MVENPACFDRWHSFPPIVTFTHGRGHRYLGWWSTVPGLPQPQFQVVRKAAQRTRVKWVISPWWWRSYRHSLCKKYVSRLCGWYISQQVVTTPSPRLLQIPAEGYRRAGFSNSTFWDSFTEGLPGLLTLATRCIYSSTDTGQIIHILSIYPTLWSRLRRYWINFRNIWKKVIW